MFRKLPHLDWVWEEGSKITCFRTITTNKSSCRCCCCSCYSCWPCNIRSLRRMRRTNPAVLLPFHFHLQVGYFPKTFNTWLSNLGHDLTNILVSRQFMTSPFLRCSPNDKFLSLLCNVDKCFCAALTAAANAAGSDLQKTLQKRSHSHTPKNCQ